MQLAIPGTEVPECIYMRSSIAAPGDENCGVVRRRLRTLVCVKITALTPRDVQLMVSHYESRLLPPLSSRSTASSTLPRGGDDDVDLVLFDVGGTIYDDNAYAQALWQAVHEIDPAVRRTRLLGRVRRSNANAAPVSLRTVLATPVRRRRPDQAGRNGKPALGIPGSPRCITDVRPTLTVLATRYKLGLVADSRENVLEAMERDGIR